MYLIHTEDVNRAGIEHILDSYFDGYTLIPALGVWHGTHEQSLIAEVVGADHESVERAAEDIRQVNHQQAVMVSEVADSTQFVRGNVQEPASTPQEHIQVAA